MLKKVLFVIFIFLSSMLFAQSPQTDLVGHWTFDDPDHLIKATVGNNLVLVGTHTATTGPDGANGAVNIGVGSYYIAPLNITPNGGGNRVNEFTIVMDVKIPRHGKWYCMYQTDQVNMNDGEWFIHPIGMIGVAATGYTDVRIATEAWYRLAIAVKNGYRYDYYVDGQLALAGTPGTVDGRFSLGNVVLLFADDNGEDNPLDVAEIKIYSRALTHDEIKGLDGYGNAVFNDPTINLTTYLQTPTPTSVYVCWHGLTGTVSMIEYGATEALGNSQPGNSYVFNDQYIWNWVKLENLQPETVYYYKIIVDTMQTEIKRFKTQPIDGSTAGHIRFAVLGDNRTDVAMHSRVINNMKEKMIELYGENIEDSINCVLNVGDIVTNGNNLPEYITEYFDCIAPLSGNIPFMVSIGNHENEAAHYYHYMKYEELGGPQGEKYYSFRIGRVLFVAVNSNYQLRNNTQITWLNNLLSDAQDDDTIDWIFVFCHHPGHSEIWPGGNTSFVQNWVIPTLKKYSKVDMLMYGHSHNYERGAVQEGNLRLMLCGGGGSGLDRWGMYDNQTNYPEIQRSFDHYCYTIIDIDVENKKYVATTYSLGHKDKYLDNVVIDEFYRDKADTTRPDQPLLVSPDSGAVVRSPVFLQAAPFSGTGDIMSSQFQVTALRGNYMAPLVNIIRDYEDLYFDTGAPDYEAVDLNEGIDLTSYTLNSENLEEGKTYWWRVRYRNKNLQWSDWSDENHFVVGIPSEISENNGDVIQKSRLYQNYPNPFNLSTTIRFDLRRSEHVTLNIYSITGELLRTLVDGNRQAGEHVVTWDGTNGQGRVLASGVYFIEIKTETFSKVMEAILTK